jgi:hypothetical protein
MMNFDNRYTDSHSLGQLRLSNGPYEGYNSEYLHNLDRAHVR